MTSQALAPENHRDPNRKPPAATSSQRFWYTLFGLGCVFVGLVWGRYLGALSRECETDCASRANQDAVFWAAVVLASATAGIAAIKLLSAAVTGNPSLASGMRWWALAGAVAFVGWLVLASILLR